jgi:hypothetical protein
VAVAFWHGPVKGFARNLVPAAKKNRMWDQVLILASELWQTLGDGLFFPHIILRVAKQ